MKKRKILGITGGAGGGKSTVLEYLHGKYKAEVLLCDEIGRELQKPGGSCYLPMKELFGESVICRDGSFDRKKIAGIVFGDEKLLRKLNEIVHPAVYEEVGRRISRASEAPFIALESALLIQARYGEICDEIWYVYAPDEVRTKRMMQSRGYSEERCEAVLRSQETDEFFRKHADLVIDNGSDDFSVTADQIDRGLTEHGFLHTGKRQQR